MVKTNRLALAAIAIAAGALSALLLAGCAVNKAKGEPEPQELPVIAYAAPAELPVNYRSQDFAVHAGDTPIDLYNAGNNSWNSPVSYGYFDLPGAAVVTITPDFAYESFELLPRSLGLAGQRDGDAITFRLLEPTNVTLVLDGNYQGKVLHLFAQAPESGIPDPDDPNVIFFAPGYHDLGEYGSLPLMIESNQTIYISGGAVVRGRLRAEGATNVTVRGRGILLNDYRSNDSYDDIALALAYVTNATIQDIIVNRDTNSWTASMYGSSNVDVLNYKAVSPRFASSDGFNIVSSHDILFDGAFIRSADDAIAVKGMSAEADPSRALPVYNITYKNAQLWSDANNGIGIGAETVAAYFRHIRFDNIDVLYNYDDRDHPDVLPDRSAINIFALHGTEFRDIIFENIRVEKAKRLINLEMDTSFYFGAIHGDWTWPGTMAEITYKNITSYSDGTNEIKLAGWSSDRIISDVAFDNLVINGARVKSTDDPHFMINSYVQGVTVE